MHPALRPCLLFLVVPLVLLASGCLLRATTDFGPGDEPRHQSVSSGVGPFPNVFRSDNDHEGGEITPPPQ